MSDSEMSGSKTMPEIHYRALKHYLTELENSAAELAPVYLIYGEQVLVKTVFTELLDRLIPAAARSLNYDPIDEATENIRDVIKRMNTFSLLPGIKVVAVRDSKIFYAAQNKEQLLQNAKSAYDNNDLKKAAAHLLNLMGHLKLSFEDLDKTSRSKALGLEPESLSDGAWLDDISGYCRQQRLSVPEPKDDCSLLQAAVEKGFPQNNHLIITTDIVDKRRGLFKTLYRKAMIIDCSVPQGERRADKMAQEAVLIEKMASMLQAAGKKMDKAAFTAVYGLTGFDLYAFCSNLEKLISYVGRRDRITREDVESVLKRTKKDPIYDLTNAVSDRNLQRALFYLDSILSTGLHPLQILAALTNQIRKLLMVKDFVESPHGSGWHAGCSYSQFQNRIMPEVLAYDRELLDQIGQWEDMISGDGASGEQKPAPKSKKKITTDLSLARNPRNPYPVYQLLLKSERFNNGDLTVTLEMLSEADFQLKSSAQSPKLILENAIFHICRPDRGE
jgi:DNA polymerase-3 subunit delta